MSTTSFLDNRCTIIGEVAQAHDGSLGMAHAFIDAVAHAGADAVKFQTHIATEGSVLGKRDGSQFGCGVTTSEPCEVEGLEPQDA